LIIDEINRPNLAQVFGELMYLLEYRDREIPLAGGNMFRIPKNFRIIVSETPPNSCANCI
jgi:5-methylcytosine-specific restriction protein B